MTTQTVATSSNHSQVTQAKAGESGGLRYAAGLGLISCGLLFTLVWIGTLVWLFVRFVR